MNQLTSGKNSAFLLVSALILTLLFALYYYVVQPKKEEMDNVQSSVNQLQADISSLKEEIKLQEEASKKASENEFALRKQLPQQRAMKELLLSLEEVEFVAQTRILTLNFNNYDSVVAQSSIEDPNQITEVREDGTVTETEQSKGTESDSETVQPVSSIARETLPDDLKMVTFIIEVQAPNRVQLEGFLKEIEGLEREMRVDAVRYALPGEASQLALEVDDFISAEIQITTFYYEGN